ncbi:MAG: glycoside hydrolase family 97 catalytic domain-containing protein [Verrucomicrobiota bacterium]
MKHALFLALSLPLCGAPINLTSPDEAILLSVNLADSVTYSISRGEEKLLTPSPLGFEIKNQPTLSGPFERIAEQRTTIDDTWSPVWGQFNSIHNHANELKLTLKEQAAPHRQIHLTFRAYDDGVAFRYHFPEQPSLHQFEITNELTTFNLAADFQTWWVEALPDTYERNYNETPLSDCAERGASTPVTLKTPRGTHLAIHEANLTDWAGMKLKGSGTSLQTDLVPWFESDVKVKANTPHSSPWRVILIGSNAGDLAESQLILNLNEPCAIEDTSWIQPAKFMGIWWGMISGVWGWEYYPHPEKHGATTERALRYIDACAEMNIPCLLIEGWCEGWEGDIPGWADMNMLKTYPDFDIQRVTDYGKSKGVTLVGHHETGGNITNYENQLPEAFELYNRYGISRIKTGYVTGDIPLYTEGLTEPGREHHHGQFAVRHHQKIIELAAKHKIMICAHEPIKATGLSRTWPNFVAREGARGGEFNHFIGNPPAQTGILPFTRLLGGPMDYTPALFDCAYTPDKRFGTRSQQLSLMVTIFSPLVMAADLYQSYHNEPAAQFIKNIPVGKWDETQVLAAEIGDYLVTTRRHDQNWFLGATNNEDARELTLPLDFLDPGTTYEVLLYQDGPGADFEKNPYPVEIRNYKVTSSDSLNLILARGGGAAAEFYPEGTNYEKPSGNPGLLEENKTYTLQAKHSGRLLTARGREVQQFAAHTNRNQNWTLKKTGNGNWLVTNGTNAITATGSQNGDAVALEPIDPENPNQHWNIKHIVGSWFHLENPASKRLLDVAEVNYADGANLHIWDFAHGANQVWSLTTKP